MKTATLPAVRIEAELRSELESVLTDAETISSFVERAVRDAVNYRRVQAEFLSRREKAWQEVQHTGGAIPSDEVFDRIEKRIEARRQQLLRAK